MKKIVISAIAFLTISFYCQSSINKQNNPMTNSDLYQKKATELSNNFKYEKKQTKKLEKKLKQQSENNVMYASLSSFFGVTFSTRSLIKVFNFGGYEGILTIPLGFIRTSVLAAFTLLATGIFSRNAFKNHMLSKTLSNAKNKKESLIQTYTDISSQEQLSTEDIGKLNDLEMQIQNSLIIKEFTEKI